jgi:hypothetical protein
MGKNERLVESLHAMKETLATLARAEAIARMTQPTPITVRHTPGCTVYVVAGHEFTTPRAAIRAADAIDRHGRYVSPKKVER